MTSLLCALASFVLLDHGLQHRRSPSKRKWWALIGAAALAGVAASWLPNRAVLQKVVGHLAMPAGLVFSAMALRTLYLTHRRRGEAWSWGGLTLAYGLAGSPWLGAALLYQLEAPYRNLDPLTDAPDTVVLLGGGTELGHERFQVGTAGDRVVLAGALLAQGQVLHLITTGSSIPGWGAHRDLTAETVGIWRQLGLDTERVIRLPEPRNTSQEMRAVAEWAEANGVEQVGLLTSAWHLPRALALARRHQLSVVPVPADFRGSVSWPELVDLLPTGAGFWMVHRAAWERLGRALGR